MAAAVTATARTRQRPPCGRAARTSNAATASAPGSSGQIWVEKVAKG